MKKIMLVFGTRPEAIKMCPVVNELKRREKFQTVVCVTGQHEEMLAHVLNIFQVVPDYNLHIMKECQNLFDITTSVLNKIKQVMEREKPDLVLVHGDTSTAFSAALAGFYLNIPIGHVEAGLRTYHLDSPFPEEYNRQSIDIMSTFLFAPTMSAYTNLKKEHKTAEKVYVTGNTVIDALKTTVSEGYRHDILEWSRGSRLILLTAHRRENIGKPMESMFKAIRRVVEEHEEIKVVYPVHLNPKVRELADKYLKKSERIKLIEPLDVVDFHNFMANSYLILTDSGGVQEEAPALGKPVLVMRDTTERPEGIQAGTLKLVGTDENKIYENFCRLLDDEEEYKRMAFTLNPYGDGNASKYIADIIEGEMGERHDCKQV